MQTIHEPESDKRASGPIEPGNATEPDAIASEDRSRLAQELYNEMAAWPARDRFGAFRKWHRGALSLIHLNVLTLLEAEGPLAMHRIAELLDVSDASATGIVDRMERRGFVERIHDTEDRRLVLVHPTTAGENVFKEAQANRLQRLRSLLDRLGDDEMAALLTGIRGLHRAAQELHQSGLLDPSAAAESERIDSPVSTEAAES